MIGLAPSAGARVPHNAVKPSYEIDLNAVTNAGSTSAPGILLIGLDAAKTYYVSQPPGRLFSGYSPWPSDNSNLPPTTPSNQKWGNLFFVTKFPGTDVGSTDPRTSSNGGVDKGYPDGETARAAAVPFTITGSTQFKFWIGDPAPADDRGGISILIQEL